MMLLPIVARELRVTSRRPATYWTRFTAGSLAIVIGAITWGILFREAPGKTGLVLFTGFAIIAYVYSLICGAIATADSVSEEKREGTLGLLFLTDLKSYDIVSGKIVASSLTAIYGLLAIFPVMAVPLLLGGVTAAEFWRVVLVCLNMLFLSLAIGMLSSALCNDERKSIGFTLLILVLLAFAWPGMVAWIGSRVHVAHPLYDLFRRHPEPLLAPSPLLTCVLAFDQPYKAQVLGARHNWFYLSLALTHAWGWIALLLTVFVLPRIWQDKAMTTRGLRRREQWKNWAQGTPDARRQFRRRLLSLNPFYWLASRDRFKTALVWLWLGAAALLWMFGLLKERRDWLDQGTYVFTALCAHTFFKCWLAMEASKRFAADRRSGALELLLSTPLTVNDILRGQWLALLRQFGPAVALICAVDFLFLGLGLKNTYHGDRVVWVGLCLAGISVFVFDLMTLALLSMWLSLKSRKSTQAGISALVRVCVVPWFLFGAFGAFIIILEEVFHMRALSTRLSGSFAFLTVWVSLSLANDALLSSWAFRSLRSRFRIVATERIEQRGRFWQRWARRKPGS